jgi:hypothetical protein
MTVAELAWRKLAKSERKAITTLLRQHPHFWQLLATNMPATAADTNERIFLRAAIGPTWCGRLPASPPSSPNFTDATGTSPMRPLSPRPTLPRSIRPPPVPGKSLKPSPPTKLF